MFINAVNMNSVGFSAKQNRVSLDTPRVRQQRNRNESSQTGLDGGLVGHGNGSTSSSSSSSSNGGR